MTGYDIAVEAGRHFLKSGIKLEIYGHENGDASVSFPIIPFEWGAPGLIVDSEAKPSDIIDGYKVWASSFARDIELRRGSYVRAKGLAEIIDRAGREAVIETLRKVANA